jgi:hypothetical protein
MTEQETNKKLLAEWDKIHDNKNDIVKKDIEALKKRVRIAKLKQSLNKRLN